MYKNKMAFIYRGRGVAVSVSSTVNYMVGRGVAVSVS
jgi:hypothetical protein